MSNSSIPTLSLIVFFFVSVGGATAITEAVRWFLGRGRNKVDQAAVVQGMALDLLKPLHGELEAAQTQAVALRRDLTTLDAELQSVLGWAIIARALLDSHGIAYPPPPHSLRKE